jgi:hypothetical protein
MPLGAADLPGAGARNLRCAVALQERFNFAGVGMAKTITTETAFERQGLSDDQLRAMLRNMLLQRQLDNRGF